MKQFLILTLFVFGIAGAQTHEATKPHKPSKPAVKCVVSGDPIDQKEFSAYKAGKVYFCCGG